MLAAQGLARLQDVRAVEQIIAVARHQGREAKDTMAAYLLYFPDARAQAAAEELLDDKRVAGKRIVDTARHQVETEGIKGLFPW
jgi:hypothetical protein